MIEAGDVGLNLEDGALDPELPVEKVRAARATVDRKGIRIGVTDDLRRSRLTEEANALRRAR